MAAKKFTRISLDALYADIVALVALRSTCLRRQVGALLIKDNNIISIGYSGACKKVRHCLDLEQCLRDDFNILSGTKLEFCFSPHAELNAILNAAKIGVSTKTAILWSTHKPCLSCLKAIINVDISKIVYLYDYGNNVSESKSLYSLLVGQSGISLRQYAKEESYAHEVNSS
ncbi:cytidine deaminase [Patescibacteria group bacterium]|nr:cytidine deaminase [Patescibacteria group bacterium]